LQEAIIKQRKIALKLSILSIFIICSQS